MLISVAVPVPLYRLFDYLPEADDLLSEGKELILQPGMRVEVPFSGRKLVGIVINTQPNDPKKTTAKLKPIIQVLDKTPTLTKEVLELITWAANYYCHPIGECINTAIPSILRKHAPYEPTLFINKWIRTEKAYAGKSNAKKQVALLKTIEKNNGIAWEEDLKQQGFKRSTLTALQDKGYIRLKALDLPSAKLEQSRLPKSSKTLNSQQQSAVDKINDQGNDYACTLLEGVTGSGKTEVYIACAQHVVQQGQQALILIPEINLSSQTLNRFQQSLGLPIGLIHSGLSQKEKTNTWHLAKTGAIKVVIGTRSAIFTPFEDLGLIIVDEEHDQSYKQTDHFKYSARDLAVKRAQIESCKVVLGSATPSLESIKNAQDHRYQHIFLSERAGAGKKPAIYLLDIRSRPLENGCARPLLNKIEDELNTGNQVLIFQNRRGFSPTLICNSCGWLMHCPNCDAKLTVHSSPPKMHCHHCDHKTKIPTDCPDCNHSSLSPLGAGTERIEFGLQNRFPEARIWRFDRDNIRNDKELIEQIEDVRKGEPGILIGTQMLAKGHDFHNITLVCVIDADASFFSSDYRAIEKSAQQITQVSGRTGRGEKPGTVIIQTRQPEHPAFQHLLKHDYKSIAQEELKDREFCELPPYTKMLSIRSEANSLSDTFAELERIKSYILEHNASEHLLVSGPIEASITKKSNIYRSYLHLFFSSVSTRQRCIGSIHQFLDSQNKTKARLFVDADPIDYI